VRSVIFVVLVYVVNIEKFQYINIIVKGLMCRVDFLSKRNPEWFYGCKSQLSPCFCIPTSYLAGKVRVGKKTCVWQRCRLSRWQAAKLLLVRRMSWCIRNLTYNGTAVEGVFVTRRNPPVDCPGCEHGVVPVSRRVWRCICKVGCGWFCDRGI